MPSSTTGWVNAHTHVYSGLVSLGMPVAATAPRGLLEILERVWWRLDRALDRDSLRAAARLYAADALLSGTVAIIDHHESPRFLEGSLDVIADACQELGLPAVLCYGATERNGGRDEARRGLAECARFCRENERGLVRCAVGLHASFTVSDDTIREAGDLARQLATVVHVHVAEDVIDVDDARQRGFEGPLQRLLELEAMPPGSIAAHGVHLTADEVRLADEHGVWLVQNPRSNRGNGVGYPAALGASERVALGTDGWASDLVDEGEALILEAAKHGEDIDRAVRRLRAGRRIVSERFGPDAFPAIQASLGSLTIAGRPIVKDGELVTGNHASIRAEAQEQAQQLWQRMAAI